MEYGCWMINKHENKFSDQSQYILNKLRQLARVRKYLQDSENKSFKWKDLLKPTQFHFLVEKVEKMPQEGTSLMKRIGNTLSDMITIYKGSLLASQANRKIFREADDYENMLRKFQKGMTLEEIKVPKPEELANVQY